MNKEVKRILVKVLDMPQQQRALIVERLIASMDIQPDSDVEVVWQREVQKRISEIEEGKIACISWEEARRRLKENAGATD